MELGVAPGLLNDSLECFQTSVGPKLCPKLNEPIGGLEASRNGEDFRTGALVLIYGLVAVFLASVALTWRASRSENSLRAPHMWTVSVYVGLASIAISSLRLVDQELKGLPGSPWRPAVLLVIYGCGFIILRRLKRT